jgi:hypothetical protein
MNESTIRSHSLLHLTELNSYQKKIYKQIFQTFITQFELGIQILKNRKKIR